MSDVEDLLGAFCGTRRTWTPDERTAAKALIEQHGWTSARASFVAEWLETAPEGRFWRQTIAARNGICAILKNVELITEKSEAAKATAHRPGWQAYAEYEDPAPPELVEKAHQTRQEKINEVQRPWWELAEEAKAKGLKGMALMQWCFAERSRRTGRPPVTTPAAMLRGWVAPMPKAAARTDVPLAHRDTGEDEPVETGERGGEGDE